MSVLSGGRSGGRGRSGGETMSVRRGGVRSVRERISVRRKRKPTRRGKGMKLKEKGKGKERGNEHGDKEECVIEWWE